MTQNETARILAVIAAANPRFQVDEKGMTLKVWHELLGDLDYNIVQLAVKKLILEMPYPPAIADVRKRAVEVMTPPEDRIDASEAWGEVMQAIRLYGYYREAEALKSMSPKAAKVVRWMGWREICLSEEPGVVRGQFLKMYQQVAEREQKERLLPYEIRDDIRKISERFSSLKLIKGEKEGA